ncbi:hypothetical protein OHB01_12575 [Microbispora hainanensis]|nr:hypothetical protein [Microbispora hainanensis]
MRPMLGHRDRHQGDIADLPARVVDTAAGRQVLPASAARGRDVVFDLVRVVCHRQTASRRGPRLRPLLAGGFLSGRTKVSLDGGNDEFPELRLCLRSSSATRAPNRSTVASSCAIVSRWASIVAICRTTSEASSSYDGRRSGVFGTQRSSTTQAVLTPA